MVFLLGLIVVAAVIGFAFLAGRNSAHHDRGSLMQPPPSLSRPPVSRTAELSTSELAQVRLLVEQGQKIEAIKLVRECTGLGLKEAKDLVEGL